MLSPNNPELTVRYKSFRNTLTKLINKRKTDCFHTLFNKNKNNASGSV